VGWRLSERDCTIAKHGWMIPGGRVYDPDNAERGFDKLMHLLDDALQSAAARLP